MRILLKCPTRSRPEKVRKTLSKYHRFANRPDLIGVAISADSDDDSMKDTSELQKILSGFSWSRIFYSPNRTKIQACNANMEEIDYSWDIVILVSDDMIPQIKGYDDIIRNEFLAGFPDTNGILWPNDGAQGSKLNTLCIYGREFYKQQGFIYNPLYKSLFCDTELTDQCNNEYKSICRYIPYCIIRHEHPGTGFQQNMDKLYQKNQTYWNEDMYTYIRRKSYQYDWSILIATITGREGSLNNLISDIRAKVSRIAPELRVEFVTYFDNRETSIGNKRQWLLEHAKGRYSCFIDDDDTITDAYVEDLLATFRGGYHVMRLRGQISQYTFTHSVENSLDGFMARGDVFIRPPNHLNPMLTDVAKMFSFKDATKGEDLEWTIRLAKSRFLTNEYKSDNSRIHYIYNLGPRQINEAMLDYQRRTSYQTMLQMVWSPTGAVAPADMPMIEEQKSQGPKIPVLRLGRGGFVSV